MSNFLSKARQILANDPPKKMPSALAENLVKKAKALGLTWKLGPQAYEGTDNDGYVGRLSYDLGYQIALIANFDFRTKNFSIGKDLGKIRDKFSEAKENQILSLIDEIGSYYKLRKKETQWWMS